MLIKSKVNATLNIHVSGLCRSLRDSATGKMLLCHSRSMNIGETLLQQHATEKEGNRKILLKIISKIRFLSRQGLAFRGDGSESDGNYLQLLKLRGEEDPSLNEWLARKANKYTSHKVQDEILKIMAYQKLRNCNQPPKFTFPYSYG